MKLSEIREAMDYLREQVHEDADVIMGQVELPDHEDSLRVTVIATGFRREQDGAVVGARATGSHATVQPRATSYPTAPAIEMPAAAQRPRASSCPPPRRSAAAAEAARQSQASLFGAEGDLLDIPTYLRKQAE
jgi:cell division protein FtsZ